jgi:ABC-type branched-subunit amino acid transport system substrate-binding protein
VERYQQHFQEVSDIYAGLAYDSLQILVEALGRADSPRPDKLLAKLGDKEPFKSLTGELTFDREHYARRPLFLVRLQGGRPEKQERYDPPQKQERYDAPSK